MHPPTHDPYVAILKSVNFFNKVPVLVKADKQTVTVSR